MAVQKSDEPTRMHARMHTHTRVHTALVITAVYAQMTTALEIQWFPTAGFFQGKQACAPRPCPLETLGAA